MTVPRITVHHRRAKGVIRVFAYAEGDPVAIYLQDIPPLKARELVKFKMTLKNALKLRYQS